MIKWLKTYKLQLLIALAIVASVLISSAVTHSLTVRQQSADIVWTGTYTRYADSPTDMEYITVIPSTEEGAPATYQWYTSDHQIQKEGYCSYNREDQIITLLDGDAVDSLILCKQDADVLVLSTLETEPLQKLSEEPMVVR